jgi:hypothetical protein
MLAVVADDDRAREAWTTFRRTTGLSGPLA